ncbi:MAG: phage tail protein, partial [Rhizobiaceae bacterium]|nr:phage tail protein [Rhizobiaceae bacterium]
DDLVEPNAESPLHSFTRAQETELPSAVKLAYVESGLDYRQAAVEAIHLGGSSAREIHAQLPCAFAQDQAQIRAEIILQESWASRERGELGLAPSHVALEPGDVIRLHVNGGARLMRIDQISDTDHRKLSGRSYHAAVYEPPEAPARSLRISPMAVYGKPDVAIMDLPLTSAGATHHSPWLAASAKPWPGTLAVYKGSDTSSFVFNRTIDAQATKGRLLEPLAAGPLFVVDRANSVTVKMENGALTSITELEMLGGRNVAAVGDVDNGWEILQFAAAELVAPRTFRLSSFLRGQSGSEIEMMPLRPAGSRLVFLNTAVVQPQIELAEAKLDLIWRIGPAQYDLNRAHVSIPHRGQMLGLRPYAPAHARTVRVGDDILISWIRRTRIDGDSWDVAEVPLGEDVETYILEIMNGTTLLRAVKTNSPDYLYRSADIASDFGTFPEAFTVRIAQISLVYGRGANLERILHV